MRRRPGKGWNVHRTGQTGGAILAQGEAPSEAFYVPPTVVGELSPASSLLREEIFGPLLAVIRAESMDEALALANDSDYALTGGLFSRSPAHISQALREFSVGNLYINRGITGAIVGRQPFGGFRLSGVGSKAGGPDYLLQFLEPGSLPKTPCAGDSLRKCLDRGSARKLEYIKGGRRQ